MASPIEDIKSRLDIVDVIQGYIRLQKAGINYKAICPFHSEKTPSFFVSPSRQIWHCFGGCGKGGDMFKFIMEIEGLDFPETLRMLATRAGVQLKREDPRIRSERNRLYDICESAAKVFEYSFSRTLAVQKYMRERGVRDETIKEFRVGFAPQSWDFLLKALAQKGYRKEEIEKAGLAIKSEDRSSWYDRFRSRIMFPITDANSRVIGFGGRIFESSTSYKPQATSSSEAKYVNTPQTLIYDKSRVLYGFDKAKQDIRQNNNVVIVEGYMDCIMSHQADVKNTIAVSGTALTPQQLTVLKRLCNSITSSFDTDAAGESATKRSLALAAQFEFERKIASIPAGKDPADAVRENPRTWQDAVSGAKPVVEFYFEKAKTSFDPETPQGKKEFTDLLLPYISELADEIQKAHWVGELSKILDVREESIWSELRKQKSPSSPQSYRRETSSDEASRLPTRRDMLEERFLTLIPMVTAEVRARELENHCITFVSSINEKLFETLHANGGLDKSVKDNLKEPLEQLRFKGEVLGAIIRDVGEEFIICKRELERQCVKEELVRIGQKIEQLEKAGSQHEVQPLLQNFRELSLKLKTLV